MFEEFGAEKAVRVDPGPPRACRVRRLPGHRPHRGAHGHRRQHRAVRRSRGGKASRTRSPRPTSRRPTRSCASCGCATSAASSSSTSSTWRTRRTARRSRRARAELERDRTKTCVVGDLAARPGGDDAPEHHRRPARGHDRGVRALPGRGDRPLGRDRRDRLVAARSSGRRAASRTRTSRSQVSVRARGAAQRRRPRPRRWRSRSWSVSASTWRPTAGWGIPASGCGRARRGSPACVARRGAQRGSALLFSRAAPQTAAPTCAGRRTTSVPTDRLEECAGLRGNRPRGRAVSSAGGRAAARGSLAAGAGRDVLDRPCELGEAGGGLSEAAPSTPRWKSTCLG